MKMNWRAGKLQFDNGRVATDVPEGLQAQIDAAMAQYKALDELTSGNLAGEDEKRMEKAKQAAAGFRNQMKIIDQLVDTEFGPEEQASGTGTVTPNAAITGGKEKARQGVEAATTGGTRNTTVNITIGQMKGVETLNVDSLEQGVADLEQRLAEAMSRVLGMAEMSVS